MDQLPEYQTDHVINHIFINDDFVLIAERAYTPGPDTQPGDMTKMLDAISLQPAWIFDWGVNPAVAFLPFEKVLEKDNDRKIVLSAGVYVYRDGGIVQLDKDALSVTVGSVPKGNTYHNLSAEHYSHPDTMMSLEACFASFKGPTQRVQQLGFLAGSFNEFAFFKHGLWFQRLMIIDRVSNLHDELTPKGFVKYNRG